MLERLRRMNGKEGERAAKLEAYEKKR